MSIRNRSTAFPVLPVLSLLLLLLLLLLLFGAFCWGTCNKPEGHGFDTRRCHWNFLLTYSFRPHYGPGVDSWVPRIFPGGKGGRCVKLTTLPPVPIVMKSESLNLLEPSGPVQGLLCYVLLGIRYHLLLWVCTLKRSVFICMTCDTEKYLLTNCERKNLSPWNGVLTKMSCDSQETPSIL